MSDLAFLSLAEAADAAIGNWLKFDSFALFGDFDPETWTYIALSHRDSDALDRTNAKVIEDTLSDAPSTDSADGMADYVSGRSSHWAVGWVDDAMVRVFDDAGEITPTFAAYHDLLAQLADYPVLDEEELSRVETDELYETLEHAYRIPADRTDAVARWLFDAHSISREEELRQDMVDEAIAAVGAIDPDPVSNYLYGSRRWKNDEAPSDAADARDDRACYAAARAEVRAARIAWRIEQNHGRPEYSA